jgi:anthranilate phosphoribosyltransferase
MTGFQGGDGWPAVLGELVAGRSLTADRAGTALDEVLEGRATPAQIAAFIVALRMKGETVDELRGLVDAMLRAAAPLELDDGVIDIVGTGGSAPRRVRALNISTMACFVAAGAGAVVCKHGNRKASSTSGSFDVLDELGVVFDLDGEGVAACVRETGVGFCFARTFHPAMRHAGPVRAELGVPTVFNILGPLSHPGGVRRQVVGTADGDLAPRLVALLDARGAPRAMVVHGDDGLDEITITTTTTIHELRDGSVTRRSFDPASVGIKPVAPDDVPGGDPVTNGQLAREMLDGAEGPVRDLAVLNAAAGLVVAGIVDDLGEGVEAARASIDGGHARAKLDALISASAARATPSD